MGFKEFFSEERQNARLADAKVKERAAAKGCLRYLIGAIVILVLVVLVAMIL